jgi:hypothetical protein
LDLTPEVLASLRVVYIDGRRDLPEAAPAVTSYW